jgi:hypothetical protein
MIKPASVPFADSTQQVCFQLDPQMRTTGKTRRKKRSYVVFMISAFSCQLDTKALIIEINDS